ncbi:hypothetical protein [Rubellimicrobium rubrum]|uniref:hypothetical protein n=1 Tax=Rubellimicrobium rubrum TaxID=2585369 RepID=UPI00159BDE77|nr:hypothetical protein [Rubellimicrobium rubrum]
MQDLTGRTLGNMIVLRFDGPPDFPAVWAGPGQLEAPLLNLVTDACEVVPNGGGA